MLFFLSHFLPLGKLVRGLQELYGSVACLTKDAFLMVAGRTKHPDISVESNWSCFLNVKLPYVSTDLSH